METPLQRVDRLLEETGKTWADLARLLRYSEQRLTNWKARGVPRAELPEVAKALGVSIDYIATGQGSQAIAAPSARAMSSRQQVIMDLTYSLTDSQLDEEIRRLKDQKQSNESILDELTRRRA